MSGQNPYGYAGWFVLDVRLLVFVLVISFLLTTGTLALFFRGKRWHEYLSVGFGFYVTLVGLLIVVFNWVVDYPVFRIESFFSFP